MKWTGPGGDYFLATHDDVYVPSDDTFLLAHTVAEHIRPGERFLEVGCGAGLVAMIAARHGAHVTATDMNPHACRIAAHNARENRLDVAVVEGDLLAGLGPFEVVAFNPPYLPTAADEVIEGPLNLAFDGGPDGNATALRFAAQVLALEPRPRLVLVVHSSLSDPAPLEDAMRDGGYRIRDANAVLLAYERLRVIAFERDA